MNRPVTGGVSGRVRAGHARRVEPPRPETALSRRPRFRWAGRIGALLIRVWGRTLRIRWEVPDSVRALEEQGLPFIYAFWHGHLLTLTYTHRSRGVVVLVSRHGDGEYISQIIHNLGYGTVRGSSTRGGLKALLEMARCGHSGHSLAVTPDGPRGPRHRLQPGVLIIAGRSGLPIVPLSAGARWARHLRSWDRFQIPLPFSRVLVTVGEPMWAPETASNELLLERWGPQVASALHQVEGRAESWSRRESPPSGNNVEASASSPAERSAGRRNEAS